MRAAGHALRFDKWAGIDGFRGASSLPGRQIGVAQAGHAVPRRHKRHETHRLAHASPAHSVTPYVIVVAQDAEEVAEELSADDVGAMKEWLGLAALHQREYEFTRQQERVRGPAHCLNSSPFRPFPRLDTVSPFDVSIPPTCHGPPRAPGRGQTAVSLALPVPSAQVELTTSLLPSSAEGVHVSCPRSSSRSS